MFLHLKFHPEFALVCSLQVKLKGLQHTSYFFNNRDFAVKFMTRVFFQIYRSDPWTVVLVGLLLCLLEIVSLKKMKVLKK